MNIYESCQYDLVVIEIMNEVINFNALQNSDILEMLWELNFEVLFADVCHALNIFV